MFNLLFYSLLILSCLGQIVPPNYDDNDSIMLSSSNGYFDLNCMNYPSKTECQDYTSLGCVWCKESDNCLSYNPCTNKTKPYTCNNIAFITSQYSCQQYTAFRYGVLVFIVCLLLLIYSIFTYVMFKNINRSSSCIEISILTLFGSFVSINFVSVLLSIIIFIAGYTNTHLIEISYNLLVYTFISQLTVFLLLLLSGVIVIIIGFTLYLMENIFIAIDTWCITNNINGYLYIRSKIIAFILCCNMICDVRNSNEGGYVGDL